LGAPFNVGDFPAPQDACGVPLSLGAINNQRSLVSLDNLVDLIVTCLTHLAVANQSFLVSDGEDVSTTGVPRRICPAMGCPVRLIHVRVVAETGCGHVGKAECGGTPVRLFARGY
jgi:nucleoside-diphosphate-sugar epimerase